MLIDHHALAIVDRKCARLACDRPLENDELLPWLHGLGPLLRWVLSVPVLNAYVRQILEARDGAESRLHDELFVTRQQLTALAERLRALPGEASVGSARPHTWDAFDGLAWTATAVVDDRKDARDYSKQLARILRARAIAFSNSTDDDEAGTPNGLLVSETVVFCDRQIYAIEAWDRDDAASARAAFVALIDLCRALHPPPPDSPDWTDIVPRVRTFPQVDGEKLRNDYRSPFPDAQRHLKRFVEELHVLGASTLSHFAAVERFKQRSVWYDKARLRAVANDRRIGGHREDRLTLELAKYLHDSGLLVFARPRLGSFEPDIVDMQGLTIEAKAYVGAARREIIDGFYQLHAYMTVLESRAIPVREGFLVVFRLGGPTYDTPPTITLGRFLIHSMRVDIGPSSSTGRNQSRVQAITEGEIVAGVLERGALRQRPKRSRRQRER